MAHFTPKRLRADGYSSKPPPTQTSTSTLPRPSPAAARADRFMGELCIEGWLHRSKKGDPTQRERRYFFSSGFAVEYCKTPDRASRTGKFDLRLVEELDEPEPGMLFVRVKGKTHPLHVFLPSPMEALQQGDGADAKAWRMLWASAVDESVVSLALESARDTNLAEHFTMLREEKRQTRALLLAKSTSALPRDSKEAEEATAPR